jgi:hypothetical protein
MAERLPDVTTGCTPEQMFYALGNAWVQLFDEQPQSPSLCCLLSQWALETGWGKSCHCWNIGNFKSSEGDGRDFTYYKCDERLQPAVAQHYLDGATPRSDGQGPNVAVEAHNADGTITLWFWPDHPVSRFRAYKTLQDGAKDYVESLFNRFSKAWPAIKQGDPTNFIHQLKVQGYFTADEATYTKTTVSLFKTFSHIPFDQSKLPIISDEHAAEIQGLIALTIDTSIRGDDDSAEKNA